MKNIESEDLTLTNKNIGKTTIISIVTTTTKATILTTVPINKPIENPLPKIKFNNDNI